MRGAMGDCDLSCRHRTMTGHVRRGLIRGPSSKVPKTEEPEYRSKSTRAKARLGLLSGLKVTRMLLSC